MLLSRMKSFLITSLLVIFASTLFAQSSSVKVKGKDYVVTISTSYGDIVVLLYDQTPLHKKNFIKLAQEHYLDSTTFHRVIAGFMIQGGDINSKDSNPYNDGQGDAGYTIPAEFRPELKHKKGSLCGARLPDQANPEKASSGSQFYIVQYDNSASHLDGNYTVFGTVISGMNVVNKISEVTVDAKYRPIQDIRMKVTVAEVKKSEIIKQYHCEDFYKVSHKL
jgi:cyclophilin family peptidyl-prolyl cis-trans isomerase